MAPGRLSSIPVAIFHRRDREHLINRIIRGEHCYDCTGQSGELINRQFLDTLAGGQLGKFPLQFVEGCKHQVLLPHNLLMLSALGDVPDGKEICGSAFIGYQLADTFYGDFFPVCCNRLVVCRKNAS